MAKKENKKKITPGKIVGILIALSILDSEMLAVLIVIGIFAGAFWLGIRAIRTASGGQKSAAPRQRTQAFDDCPKPVCFHKDRGTHHLYNSRERDPWDRPNREIDPWDRPDVDIRKYQRR